MKELPVVSIVCEGESDRIVLEAVLYQLFPDGRCEIREPREPGRRGGRVSGWTQVQRWCERHGPVLESYLPCSGIDVLIVHVDADARSHLQVGTTEELCATVKRWLRLDAERLRKLPQIIIVIPKESTEAWLVAAAGSPTPQIEKIANPRERLISLHELPDRDVPWSVRKQRYEHLSAQLAAQLTTLGPMLVELKRFIDKVKGVLPSQATAP